MYKDTTMGMLDDAGMNSKYADWEIINIDIPAQSRDNTYKPQLKIVAIPIDEVGSDHVL